MLGFVVVDHQVDSPETAVWLTSRAIDSRANNSNAVLLSRSADVYQRDLRSLIADRVLVLTEGSVPLESAVRYTRVSAFSDLLAETVEHQQRIDAAIDQARTKSRKLVDPRYPTAPEVCAPEADDPVHRALATANHIVRCWDYWLETENQRVIRAKTKPDSDLPPIMPPGLDDPDIEEYPPRFLSTLSPEPLTIGDETQNA